MVHCPNSATPLRGYGTKGGSETGWLHGACPIFIYDHGVCRNSQYQLEIIGSQDDQI